jgi:hypothetical protein
MADLRTDDLNGILRDAITSAVLERARMRLAHYERSTGGERTAAFASLTMGLTGRLTAIRVLLNLEAARVLWQWTVIAQQGCNYCKPPLAK